MAEYPDLGGHFASDAHRRVLAHLSHPEDDFGWTVEALFHRMEPDVGSSLSPERLAVVLSELEKDGHAVCHEGGVWQQTESGHKLLTGSIANEPPPGSPVARPATLGLGATLLRGSNA